MSSSRASASGGGPRRRRFRWACIAVLVSAAAGACGFQPLYGDRATAAGAAELAEVRINPIRDRIGQQLHNFLRDRLNPLGPPRRAHYVLNVTLTESKRELAIRKDEIATRANLTLTAAFQLRDQATGAVLLENNLQSTNSYNIVTSDFATLSAENDARRRAARELSDGIKTRLAVFFARARRGLQRPPAAPGPSK